MMEENAQMSLLPDAVGATQMTMTGEEEIDLSECGISSMHPIGVLETRCITMTAFIRRA